MTTVTATRLITAEEFMVMRQPKYGSKEELVRGEIVTTPTTKSEHGLVQSTIEWLLMTLVYPQRLGWVGSASGVITERDPDSVCGPDVAFFSIERMPNRPSGYPGISPDDRPGPRMEKLREYLAAKVGLVWDVNPDDRSVIVYPWSTRIGLSRDRFVDWGEVLPTFTCQVAQFFA